jgi:HlyD family secretion protein
MVSPKQRSRRTWSIAKPLGIGIFATLMVIGAVGVWAANVQIAGAVIAKGKIEVSTVMTAVQHPIGGVVAEVLAGNGDRVVEGQVLLRLDDAELRSELRIIEGDLFESIATQARLEAIMEDRRVMEIPAILEDAIRRDERVRALVDRQRRQLAEHYESIETETHLLREQIRQVDEQIAGVRAELESKVERTGLIKTELGQLKELADKGLVRLTVLYSLEKENLTNDGEVGQLRARIAELRGKISELELTIHTIAPDAKEKLSAELAKARPDTARFSEKRSGILEEMSKLEIRAPISGTVHDSKVNGVRSVFVAASPIMHIVPRDTPLIVQVRVFDTDIDQVFVGQKASMKFLAFNGRRLPIILGEVSRISADAFLDSLLKMHYYDVLVELSSNELKKLGDRSLMPGMPVEAFLATESRTPLSYLTRPLVDYLDRAFRD